MAHRAESVFVDATGRRRRLTRRAGLAATVLLAGYLIVVGVGFFAGADVPLTPWPGNDGAGTGVGAELGRQRGATPQPVTRPTTNTPSASPPAGATPSRAATAPATGRAATTPPARPNATPPGRTKSPNPRKP